ncbi:hypothetical protein [Chitinophaga sp. OAE865]|uniref:hypothetical protein n=1 Tax=Chitinophaga sp. OAE865 TaxID=2817898 RepID=UPI001AE94A51
MIIKPVLLSGWRTRKQVQLSDYASLRAEVLSDGKELMYSLFAGCFLSCRYHPFDEVAGQ